MTPGEETKAFIGKEIRKLPASTRTGDEGRWIRNLLAALLILVGCAILLIQVFRNVAPTSWLELLPAGIPLAAGLFLVDPAHLIDAVRAGRKP